MTTPPSSRTERSRQAVLATTFELLYETGVGGFSVDEVARRSGVAKTTIYRRWPTREALVLDACAQLTPEPDVPDTGSLEVDLRTILSAVARQLQSAHWASVLPSIVDAAEREPGYAELHKRIQRGHATGLRTVLERARERGELAADVDTSTAVAELLGPLFYRRWFARQRIDKRFIDRIVHAAVGTARQSDA